MDRVEIPGMYYDEEKNKFFPIVPYHEQGPTGSRYDADSVRIEQRARKRQKLEHETQEQLFKARPRLAMTSRLNNLTGSLLSREYGECPKPGNNPVDFMANGLTRNDVVVNRQDSVYQAFPLPNTEEILLNLGNDVQRLSWDNLTMTADPRPHRANLDSVPCQSDVFFWQKSSQEVTTVWLGLSRNEFWGPRDELRLFWCDYNAEGHQTKQMRIRPLGGDDWLVGGVGGIAFHDGRLVIGNKDALVCINMNGNERFPYAVIDRPQSDLLSLDIQGDNIVAAALDNNIHLWDLRANATASRLSHGIRPNGIRLLEDNTQMLIGDLWGLSLHDLRMTSKSRDRHVLRFDGAVGVQRTRLDVSSGVVATFMDDQLKLLSLRRGRQAAAYDLPWVPSSEHKPLDIRWCEDARGCPYVQMCRHGSLYRWSVQDGGVDC